MAKVFCYKKLCAYRSKRKSGSVNKRGEPLYRCLLDDIIILDYCPSDEQYYADGKVCECLNFKLIEGYEKVEDGD